MQPTHATPGCSLGRLGALTVVFGAALYMAAVSCGVLIMLNAIRGLAALPCGAAWAPCMLHP
jgi:hypothetical protein